MRAVLVKAFGGPEVLEAAELPDPVAGPGEAVIAVSVIDTLFVETWVRAGRGPFPIEPPYVPGGGVAGTVASVGDGVDRSWIGHRVVAILGQRGGYAERALAPVDTLVPIPDGVGFRDAAALVHDATTGMGLYEALAPRPGETVLVLGATGGMGVLLVQLARAAGARVLAGARGDRKLRLVEQLGAEAVDVSDPDWTTSVVGGVDVVLDGVGGKLGLAAFELTRDGGRFSAHGAPTGGFAPVDPVEAGRRGIVLRGIADLRYSPAERVRLTALGLAAAAEGRIRPVIGQTFPLERAADAHAAIEARTVIGKTLLLV